MRSSVYTNMDWKVRSHCMDRIEECIGHALRAEDSADTGRRLG